MATPLSPVVASWELALRLRERRAEVGVEVRRITDTLGFSRNFWSAIENERKTLSRDSLEKLIELLDFSEEEGERLLMLRDATKGRGWWAEYSGVFDSELRRLFGLEYGAVGIRGYESLFMPGLLQTADYARAIIDPDVTVRRVEVDQRVEVRLRRQERLTGDDPLHLTAIVSEAALWQEIGGPDVLRAQLDHLLKMIEQYPENLDFRIVPFTAISCGLFGSATVEMIDFKNPRLPTVIWQETVTTWGVIDDPVQVRDITMAYNEALKKKTLGGRAAVEMIHNRRKALH